MSLFNKNMLFTKQNIFLLFFSLVVMLIVAIPLVSGYAQQANETVFTSVRVPDRGDYWVYF